MGLRSRLGKWLLKQNNVEVIAMPVSEATKNKNAPVTVKNFFSQGETLNRDTFAGPYDFDMVEITTAYSTDSYVRQAVDEIISFMFKSGHEIVGKDQGAVDYVKLRLKAMEFATNKPFNQFLTEVGEDLVMYHNVFIIKARAPASYKYPGNISVKPVIATKTVAGYFVLPPETVEIKRDERGNIKEYRQNSAEGEIKYKPSEIIHIYADRPRGRAYGIPFLAQVLDDVRLLRNIEEMISRLIHKETFPLLHYTIGTEEPGGDAEVNEIDDAAEALETLTRDGALITNARHKITIIGSEGKALSAHEYLKYFEARVFTGLGVSEVVMGRGATSSKSTSDNMYADMHDKAKAYLTIVANFFKFYIINELLFEGGYLPTEMAEDAVYLQFNDTDQDAKIKIENQAIQKHVQGATTFEEMRLELKLDPISPEDEKRLYYNMTGEVASPDSVDNAAQPANQHVKKLAASVRRELITERLSKPKNTLREETRTDQEIALEIQEEIYLRQLAVELDTVKTTLKAVKSNKYDDKNIEYVVHNHKEAMNKCFENNVFPIVRTALSNAEIDNGKRSVHVTETEVFKTMKEEHGTYVSDKSEELAKHFINGTEEEIEEALYEYAKTVAKVARWNVYKAYNYAYAKGCMSLKRRKAYILGEKTCEQCQEDSVIFTTSLEEIPPFHDGCKCIISLINPKEED